MGQAVAEQPAPPQGSTSPPESAGIGGPHELAHSRCSDPALHGERGLRSPSHCRTRGVPPRVPGCPDGCCRTLTRSGGTSTPLPSQAPQRGWAAPALQPACLAASESLYTMLTWVHGSKAANLLILAFSRPQDLCIDYLLQQALLAFSPNKTATESIV